MSTPPAPFWEKFLPERGRRSSFYDAGMECDVNDEKKKEKYHRLGRRHRFCFGE